MEETCSKCGRRVSVIALERPADQTSECNEAECPINAEHLKPLPEFPDEDEVIFAHQIVFSDGEE
jgi:hypothetical protein